MSHGRRMSSSTRYPTPDWSRCRERRICQVFEHPDEFNTILAGFLAQLD